MSYLYCFQSCTYTNISTNQPLDCTPGRQLMMSLVLLTLTVMIGISTKLSFVFSAALYLWPSRSSQQRSTECITARMLQTTYLWFRLISGIASHGSLGHAPPRLPSFHFSSLWSKSDSQLMQILCRLRDRLVQMSTTRSSFDQYCISHKTISHHQLLHPALKFAVSAPWPNFQLCPSSQHILATPLRLMVIFRSACHSFWNCLLKKLTFISLQTEFDDLTLVWYESTLIELLSLLLWVYYCLQRRLWLLLLLQQWPAWKQRTNWQIYWALSRRSDRASL